MRVGIEIGGTFTDLVALGPDGRLETYKVPSTPAAPADGARDALLGWGGDRATLTALVHGSTVATNAVIERKGARLVLLVTRGFRDILEIQRHEKADIFDINYNKPVPIVPRQQVLEVDERLDPSGDEVAALLVPDALVRAVMDARADAVAICLLHSYVNPAHEQALAEALAARLPPGISIALSSRINPEYREYERASTTVLSAYLQPIVDAYMTSFASRMNEAGARAPVQIMQSSGGVIPLEAARHQAVRVVLSGPAAGVIGAAHVAHLSGFTDVITLDMGGTSADVCLVRDGAPSLSFESKVDGLPIRVPAFDIEVVGAGGGSIARRDDAGLLQVGPESAGAFPGPCCYGRGGTLPTTTDANALLGLIRPQRFFGGRIALRLDLAERAVGALADSLGLSLLACAEGIRRVSNAHMTATIRLVSVARGHDPREFALLAFGGAGGLHACELAEELQIDTVIVPENQGVLSALGLLVSDHSVDLVRSVLRPAEAAGDAIEAGFAALAYEAATEMREFGTDTEAMVLEPSLDIRYSGQASELNLPFDWSTVGELRALGWVERFHHRYRARYGHNFPRAAVEVVNLRLHARVPTPPPAFPEKPRRASPEIERAPIFFGGEWREAGFVWRPELGRDATLDGPTVVEDDYGTTFVPPGWRLTTDRFGTLVIRMVTA